ncbi:MAG: hypothetical protein ABWY27_10180 [Telluria sp.]
MISTPEDDVKKPNSGGQKGVPDERSRLIEEAVDDKGNRQKGDGGEAQVSVPQDMPKE